MSSVSEGSKPRVSPLLMVLRQRSGAPADTAPDGPADVPDAGGIIEPGELKESYSWKSSTPLGTSHALFD